MKKITLFTIPLTLLLLLLLVFPQQSHAWEKSIDNPVFDINTQSSFGNKYVSLPHIIFKDNEYKMWYIGNINTSGIYGIGYAHSSDGIHNWVREPAQVIENGSSDGWESFTTDPVVIYNPDKKIYQMWYTSVNFSHWTVGKDRFRTRYAWSNDGITWNRRDGWVLKGDDNTWDEGGIANIGTVLYKDGKYHMWYSGTDSENIDNFWRIGYATSSDGITWTKGNGHQPVLSPTKSWELNNVSYPNVIYDNGKYRMWYAVSDKYEPLNIAYAESNDGINWTKPSNLNPSLEPSGKGFDATNILSAFVLRDGDTYKLWYSGLNGSYAAIGYATEDAFTFNETHDLPVPYFSQNASPWGPREYDDATALGFLNPTMDRWGCAVTSAAMVMKYHGINQMADGTPLDPGSLNQWLKTHHGYMEGYGTNGSYSYFNWPTIGKLSKDLVKAGKSPVELMHRRYYPSDNTIQLLNSDLTINKIPDILYVKNNMTSGHFVVAKGINGDTYDINDPEWGYPDLASFGNSYMQVDRYIPSHTDLSYILLVVNPDVDILVTDPNGDKTGKIHHDGVVNSYNQITNATYAFESPIDNPDPLGIDIQHLFGTGVNVFMLPTPAEGKYTVTLSGNANSYYTLNSALFEVDGDNSLDAYPGTVDNNSTEQFTINFSQNTPSTTTNPVTFESMIEDIKKLESLNMIKGGSGNGYIAQLSSAQKMPEKNNMDESSKKLDILNKLLNNHRGKTLSEPAYQLLRFDLNALKNNISTNYSVE